MNRVRTARLVVVGASALLLAQPAPAVANPSGTNVVISEVQSRAANVDNDIANAVELYNANASEIDLSGWQLAFTDSSGVRTISDMMLFGSIQAHAFIVISHPDYQPVPIKPTTTELSYSPSSGVDAIPDSFGICLSDGSSEVVDAVGTTVDECVENSPAPSLNAQTDLLVGSIQRDWLGTDTDNNSSDFRVRMANWGWLES